MTQGTFSPFSQTGWSSFLPGTVTPTAPGAATPGGDYYYGSTNLWATTTSTFTVDGWIFPTSYSTTLGLIIGDNSPDGATAYESVRLTSTGKIEFYWYDGASKTCTGSTTVPLNQWSYFAVRVSSNAISIYVNSSTADTLSGTTTLTNRTGTANFCIGVYAGSTNNSYKGYISNLRFSTVARTISVPTAAFTSDADTKLLTFQNSRVVDNSPSPLTISQVTGPSVQAFSPFAPTAAYSAATNGGSGYFDGIGDSLSTQATGQFAPAGDFTIGIWFYPTSLAATVHLIGNYTANATTDWLIEVLSTGTIQVFLNGSTLRLSGSGVTVNQWQYISITRSGTTVTGQLNGTNLNSTPTYTLSGTFGTATKAIHIGMRGGSGGTNPFTGYIGDIRLVDGQAVTTVPTAPMTQSSQGVTASNTKLLLNFTNAGITDATAKNVLETVGNAQISTTQSKFGGSSMYFDGTVDYLFIPQTNNPLGRNLDFVNGDFTIEFWFRANSVSPTNQGLFTIFDGNAASRSEIQILINLASSSLNCNAYQGVTNNDITFSSAISINTWYHVAFVRSGNSFYAYLDGSRNATIRTITGDLNSGTTWVFQLGRYTEGGVNYDFNGYIDDLRVTKFARYSGATITVPTAAFPLQ